MRALVIYSSVAEPKAQSATHHYLQTDCDLWRGAVPASKRGNVKT